MSIRQNGPLSGWRGMSDSLVWEEIVVRLRLAGLRILSEEEWERTPGRPYLFVELTDTILAGDLSRPKGYFCTCTLNLMQEVSLTRSPVISADACTWSRGGTIVDPSDNREPLRILIDRLASEFVAAVQEANSGKARHSSTPSVRGKTMFHSTGLTTRPFSQAGASEQMLLRGIL